MKIGRSKIIGLALASHAMFFWPATLHAQIVAPPESAQLEFGPFSLYPSLQIVDAGKDQNVFNDGTVSKEDYTFTLVSRALVVTRLGLSRLMFSAGSDYVWFQKYQSERSRNAVYALRFNFSASRFRPFIGAERLRTRTRPNHEIDLRARRLERSALGGSDFDLTERIAISVSARLSDTSFEKGEKFRGTDLSDALGRKGRQYSGGVRYKVTPLTTFGVGGSYGEDIFPRSHIRDSETYSLAPSIEFSQDAAIRGSFTVGYEVFKPADPELDQYRGTTAAGSLNWALYNRTVFEVGVNRNVSYSYQDGEPYYLLTTGSLSVGQPLIGPLSLQGSASYDRLAYRWRRGVAPPPSASTSGSLARTDYETVFRGGVGLNLGRGFKVVIAVERSTRRSLENSLQNYRKTRLLSTLTVGS